MANRFNPETRVDTGQQYDFRGTDGNRAWGTLIGGAADIADTAVKAGVRAVSHGIEKDAWAGEQAIQDNLFNTDDVALAQASTTSGGQAMPEDLNRGMKEALRLKQAYVKGAIRESDYLANVDVLAKKLRSKYGAQWSPEIDAAVGAAMSNTANKFRKQLFSEFDKEADAASDFTKQMRSFVQKYPEHYSNYPDMFQNPQNYSMAEHLQIVGPREARKWDTTLLNAEADLADNRTEAGKKSAESALYANTQLFLDTFADKAGQPYTRVLADKIKTMGEDQHFSEPEKAALNAWLNEAEVQMRIGWNQIAGQKRFMSLPPNVKEAAYKQITDQFDMWKSMVHDNATGAMAYNLNRFKAVSQDTFLNWIKNDPNLANESMAYMSLKEMGIGEIGEEYFRQRISEGSLDEAADHGFTLFAQGLLGPDRINEAVERLYNAPEGASKEAQRATLKAIDFTINTLMDDRSPLEVRRRAGSALFNPKYSGRSFLSYYNGSRGADGASPREKLYYRVVTPGTIAAMKSLKETDNTSWFNFYTWSVDESFDVMLKQDFDQLVADREYSGVKYDSQTGKFSQRGPQKAARGSEDRQRVEQKANDRKKAATDAALGRINFWVTRIKPVIEAEGLTVDQELLRIFEARGFTNAIDLLPSEEDVTNEEAKKGKGDKTK